MDLNLQSATGHNISSWWLNRLQNCTDSDRIGWTVPNDIGSGLHMD